MVNNNMNLMSKLPGARSGGQTEAADGHQAGKGVGDDRAGGGRADAVRTGYSTPGAANGGEAVRAAPGPRLVLPEPDPALLESVRIEADIEQESLRMETEEAATVGKAKESAQGNGKPVSFGKKRLLTALHRNFLGDAELYQEACGDRFVFDHTLRIWYRFRGHCFKEDKVNEAHRALLELAEHYDDLAVKRRKEIAKENPGYEELPMAAQNRMFAEPKALADRAKALRGARNRREDVFAAATAGDGSMGIDGEGWNADPTLLACANGVVDLETGKLQPGTREMLINKSSPAEFHGLHVEAPTWTDGLWKAFCHDAEMVDYFERLVGYAATGLVLEKGFYCLHGPSADNAKSTIMSTIQAVLGEYAGSIPVRAMLENDKKSGPEPEMVKVRDLRMIVTSEAPDGGKFSMDTLKLLTGSDVISARTLFKDLVEFKSIAKLFLHTNVIPDVRGHDPAFFNRLRIIPFEARFVGPEDVHLVDPSRHIYPAIAPSVFESMLRREWPGILAWIARCAKRFIHDGDLTPPARVRFETDDYRDDQDIVGQWFDVALELGPDHMEQAQDLYFSFVKWCRKERSISRPYIKSQKVVARDLMRRLKRDKSGNVVKYYGARILSQWFVSDEEREEIKRFLGLSKA